MVLRVPADLGLEALTTAVQALLDHHDMLRARLSDSSLVVAPPAEVNAADVVRRVEASGDLDRAVTEQAREAAARLDPEARVMAQVVWLDAGAARPGRLLIVIHHLVMDGVSWRILVPDLEAAWRAVASGRPVELAPVGTSFRRWASLLVGRAREPGQVAELASWKRLLDVAEPVLGARPPDPERDRAATVRSVSRTMTAHRAESLLTSVPAAFHSGVDDVLLAGLAVAVAEWRHGRGDDTGGVLVDIGRHGHEQTAEDVDVSRTVGWFTSIVPVHLDAGVHDFAQVRAGGAVAGQAVKRVKEQLAAIPGDGRGYGLLRYLNPESAAELAALPDPQVGFSYLGRLAGGTGEWEPTGETVLGGEHIPVTHVVEVLAYRRDRGDGSELTVTLLWPEGIITGEAVQKLADGWLAALDGLITHVADPRAGGRTPSDLNMVSLSQDQVEELETMWRRQS